MNRCAKNYSRPCSLLLKRQSVGINGQYRRPPVDFIRIDVLDDVGGVEVRIDARVGAATTRRWESR